jgi:hypothetical protein
MHNIRFAIAGFVLIGIGVLYLRRPMLYRRGLWLKTSIAIRVLSEANYRRYIKALGVIFIVAGIGLVAYALVEPIPA